MNARARLPAEVRFENAPAVLEAATQALRDDGAGTQPPTAPLPAARTLHFDLSGCERFDSSLVAVLIELLRRGQARGVALRFDSPPRKLLDLVTLYGVESPLFEADPAVTTADAR